MAPPDQTPVTAAEIDESYVPRPAPGLRGVTVGDELVLLDGWSSATTLNQVGALIWTCFDGEASLAEIARELSDATGADPEVVQSDVVTFTQRAAGERLLEGIASDNESEMELVPIPDLEVGEAVPDAALQDLDGNERTLADFHGREALLVHWSPHCGYCGTIADLLGLLVGPLDDVGVQLVLISAVDAEANRNLASAAGLTGSVLVRGPEVDPFIGHGTPCAYRVDAAGRLLEPIIHGSEAVLATASQLAGVDPVTLLDDSESDPVPAGTRYLLADDGECKPLLRSRVPTTWAGTRAYRLDDVHAGVRFFQRQEIKHALAYLRLLANPRDETSFMRVVNFPARGIGARSLEQLQDVARATGCSLHDAVSAVPGRAGAAVAGFVAKIDVLREQTAGMNLRDIIAQMLEHSGLIDHYKADREGADRLENLDELVNAAESFVMQEGFGRDAAAMTVAAAGQSPASQGLDMDAPELPPDVLMDTGETLSPLVAFLTHAALEAGDNMAEAGQDAIQLMTVHSSKGLEFDCVFITGMEEGLFPHENSMNDRDGLEEERRLMYVAITRARKRLYLSHSQSRMLHGQTRFNMKSRFFEELPEEALKWLTPKNQNFGRSWNADSAMHSGVVYSDSTRAGAAFGQTIARKEEPTHGLRLGMLVFHAKFGEGTVLTLEGTGGDARAQINFPRHGTKWLALSVAKLTPFP